MKSLIIIPTYNEKENVEMIIARIFSVDNTLEILVVDDNSPDGTGAIIEKLMQQDKRLHVLHRKEKMGLGRAYIAGFEYAIANRYDVIFEMDADFSHNPRYLPIFLDTIKTADIVIGSRYLKGGSTRNWPLLRLLLSYCGNLYIRFVTGMPIKDATGGFKCFRRQVLESLDFSKITSEGYAFQVEVNYLCWKKGFSIQEIPIVFEDRKVGETKMSGTVVFEALKLVWGLRFRKIQ
ncbi:MAG: polyprenol monophosphomannose synthase [Proteobacteria bacterium]|nr:polyprenol monophosphomannose synthase [Pseudomonadota bacterium]